MPKERLSMRKISEILRLRHEFGLSHRDIATSCKVARSTVGEYLRRAEAAGIGWPVPEGMGESELYDLLYPAQAHQARQSLSVPDWRWVYSELKRKGTTLQLLWDEYAVDHPDDHYSYTRFCELYRAWTKRIKPTMRLPHPAGRDCHVDYAGLQAPYLDPTTGEICSASIFVAVLPASDYAYAEAQADEKLPNWIGGHINAFEFFGGAPEILIPDNLKTGVTHACYYEPDLNRAYHALSLHYDSAVLPARVRRARDKAAGEKAVQDVERHVIAPLRHELPVGLAQLNALMRRRLNAFLDREMKVFGESRRQLFERMEKPALRPLPKNRFQLQDWKSLKVAVDYHVRLDNHHYSVPHRLIGEPVEARITDQTIEIFHDYVRVASHLRSYQRGGHTTDPDHMPKSHREHVEWTPERFVKWAATKGSNVARMVEAVMASRQHPQQGFRAAMGIIRLADKHGAERLDEACAVGLKRDVRSYKGIQNLLKRQYDQVDVDDNPDGIPDGHDYIRGSDYYE